MLNKKVFSRFGKGISFKLSPPHIEALINAKVGAIESALYQAKYAIEMFNANPPPYPQKAIVSQPSSGSRSRISFLK